MNVRLLEVAQQELDEAVTTEPNELMREIHDRMPVIVKVGDYGTWLDPANHDLAALRQLISPYLSERIEAYAVQRDASNPKNEGAEMIARAE